MKKGYPYDRRESRQSGHPFGTKFVGQNYRRVQMNEGSLRNNHARRSHWPDLLLVNNSMAALDYCAFPRTSEKNRLQAARSETANRTFSIRKV